LPSNEPLAPGLSVFLVRGSSPAWKWQVAQATLLSLPACISQKNAFPSWTAEFRSAT
jgi:hypothetical protein